MEHPQPQPKGAVAAPAAANGGGELIGYVDVHVQSARDIQNICIYHKQDVYARVSLPGEGAPVVASTQVVNGGGRNPVFDQSLRLGVRAGDVVVDAALRCEVWMLSRVKNYLQDQLLGFALVPLAEVVAADGGTLAREFQLTTSDLFQTPSGFLQLELSYIGVVPEVVPISPTPKPALADPEEAGNAATAGSGTGNGEEYEKIVFPDLNLVEENQIMVSEYTGLAVEPQSSESLLTSEDGDGSTTVNHDAGVRFVESLSSTADSVTAFRSDTPVSSVSTTESPAATAAVAAVPATPQSSSDPVENAHSSAEHKQKAASEAAADADVDSSRTVVQLESLAAPAVNSPGTVSGNAADSRPVVVSVNIDQEVTVDQNQIMDMYMKSMQQFTDSLAKMKLPLDVDNNGGGSTEKSASASHDADSSGADSGAVKKPVAGNQEKPSPRVFYGSRAFF